MGLAGDAPFELLPALSIDATALPAAERAEALLARHPLIKVAEADYAAAEQQLRLEIRRQYPDLDIGPSYSFDEGLSRFGLGVGISLPLWNRNRQAIAEALAVRTQARAQAEAIVEQVLSELAQAEVRLDYASQRRTSLLEDVAPLVEKQVEDSRTLLGLGEIDVLLLRDALTGSLDTKLALLEAAVDEQRAAIELQQMLQPQWFTPLQAKQEED